jgi:hypothetical protein
VEGNVLVRAGKPKGRAESQSRVRSGKTQAHARGKTEGCTDSEIGERPLYANQYLLSFLGVCLSWLSVIGERRCR